MKTVTEQYEWCFMWWEEADKHDKPRVLLIGDSIVKGYWPYANERMKGVSYIDILTTSKAVDNAALLSEIKYMLGQDEYQYDVIVLNNGLHGMHLGAVEYKEHLGKIADAVAALAGSAQLLLSLSTPVTVKDDVGTADEKVTLTVIERNSAMRAVAAKRKLEIIDLYETVEGKRHYRAKDGYHYNKAGCKALAKEVAKVLIEKLKQGN